MAFIIVCKDNYSAASLNVFTAQLEAVGVEIMAGKIIDREFVTSAKKIREF